MMEVSGVLTCWWSQGSACSVSLVTPPLQTVQYSEASENKCNVQHRLPTLCCWSPLGVSGSLQVVTRLLLDLNGCKKSFSKIKLLIPRWNCYFYTNFLLILVASLDKRWRRCKQRNTELFPVWVTFIYPQQPAIKSFLNFYDFSEPHKSENHRYAWRITILITQKLPILSLTAIFALMM